MNEQKQIEEAIPADAVKQALKCCASETDNCYHCPFKMRGAGIISESCIDAMSRAALDLICRKQSEGEWVETAYKTVEHGFVERKGTVWMCTNCRRASKRFDRYMKFCPECGAKMKGEDDGREKAD